MDVYCRICGAPIHLPTRVRPNDRECVHCGAIHYFDPNPSVKIHLEPEDHEAIRKSWEVERYYD